ncbi:MAG: nucleoid DNA-binding protein [Granulosicoccus sp.]|jgi:nucleoid DNA-binding protein
MRTKNKSELIKAITADVGALAVNNATVEAVLNSLDQTVSKALGGFALAVTALSTLARLA